MAHEWEKGLMVHDWPECGPGRMEVEELYQLFKRRLIEEMSLESKQPSAGGSGG